MTAIPTHAPLVRPVRREDRMGWLRLWTDYQAHGRSGETALPDAVTDATWERFFHEHEPMEALHEHEPMEALVAEREERLVGLAHIVFHRSTSVTGPVCFL
jgi:hypothetical protein